MTQYNFNIDALIKKYPDLVATAEELREYVSLLTEALDLNVELRDSVGRLTNIDPDKRSALHPDDVPALIVHVNNLMSNIDNVGKKNS